jgi:hypothetical protein
MESKKILFSILVLVFLTSSTGFTLDGIKYSFFPGIFGGSSPQATPCKAAYGALFGNLLCPLIPGIIAKLPNPLSLNDTNITDLTIISEQLKGHLELWNIEISGLPSVNISTCSMITPEDTAPLTVGLDVNVAHIELKANYRLDATALSIVPIYGEGELSLAIEISARVDTLISFCPYEDPMAMIQFEYGLTLNSPLDINLTGLLDGAAFVEEIIKKIENPDTFISIEQAVHKNVTDMVPKIANPLLVNFTPCTFLGC